MSEPRRLDPSERDAAVDVLDQAFADYPVMRYVAGVGDQEWPFRRRALIEFYTDKRFHNGWPVLGIGRHGALVAVATVSPPEDGSAEVAHALDAALRAKIGGPGFERMERFERAVGAAEPEGPHHLVGMLGVLPEQRGRGHARVLLTAVQALSREAGSLGVCLSTEDPVNVPIYRRLGFRTLARTDLGDLVSWSLVRDHTD